MKTIILAGGKGTRLMPLTKDKPKPMVEILKRPMLEWIINLLRRQGFCDIVLAVGYKSQVIKEYFGDGKVFGVKISYSHDSDKNEPDTGKFLGTAGCVKKAALSKREGKPFIGADEDFLVIAGDAFTNIDIKGAYEEHQKNRALATLVLKRVDDITGLGVVKTEGNKIVEFLEKPDPRTFKGEPVVNTGIYVFNSRILELIPDVLPEAGYDFGKTLFPAIVSSKDVQLNCVMTENFWSDLGTIESLEKTSEYAKENLDKFC